GHMWVPMDDHNTMIFNWMLAADDDKPLTPKYVLKAETSAGRGPGGESDVRHRTRENDWLVNREVQRSQTYTGIEGSNTQDLAVLVVALALTACGGATGANSSSAAKTGGGLSAADKTPFRLGVNATSVDSTVEWLAQSAGVFAKNGVNADLQAMAGAASMNAL